MEPFVNAQEVARHAGVSLGLVRKWTTRSYFPIPYHRLPGGRSIRFRLTEVDSWISGFDDVSA